MACLTDESPANTGLPPMLVLLIMALGAILGIPALVLLGRLVDRHVHGAHNNYIRALRQRNSARARLKVFLFVKTRLGLGWEILQSVLSLLSLVVYIMSTYSSDHYLLASCVLDEAVELFFLAGARPRFEPPRRATRLAASASNWRHASDARAPLRRAQAFRSTLRCTCTSPRIAWRTLGRCSCSRTR